MNAANENPLNIPASLAANGMQGADASDGQTAGEFDHTSADALLRLGVMFALQGCDALASLTDAPARGMVEACDCIAAAAHHLAVSAECSETAKRARAMGAA